MSLLRLYAEAAIERGSVDEWHIWNFARDSLDDAWLRASFPALRRTGDDRRYHLVANATVPVKAATTLRFDVRSGHDAHIALVPRRRGPSYELVLGGWGNSAVALRKWPAGILPDHAAGNGGPPVVIRPAPALLSARAWRSIAIELRRRPGYVEISLVVEGRELLRFVDEESAPSPFDVAAMAGYGADAEWRFAADQHTRVGLHYAAPNSTFHHWNEVYHYYAAHHDDYDDTVFLKCDDDIVHFDLDRLDDFVSFRRREAGYFLLSANVVNNGVCAHVQQKLGLVPASLGDMEMPPDGFRGSLWASGAKAERIHRHFLDDPSRFREGEVRLYVPPARFSINFVSWLARDLQYFETRFADDEADLTMTLPRFLNRQNAIYLPFVAAHLSFRPQDATMDMPQLLSLYRQLADQRLHLASPERASDPDPPRVSVRA